MRETMARSEDHINQRLDQIENDVRWLNNLDAVTIACNQADLIAAQIGLSCQRQLPRSEIIGLSRSQESSDIPLEGLRSFQRAHLIIEATDGNGILQYVAVEAAFIASTKHVQRATNNANYLTRLTTHRAWGVIAAVRIDHEIQNDIDNEQVIWYQLDKEG